MNTIKTPHGYKELVKTFGDLTLFLDSKGVPSNVWNAMMTTVNFPLPIPSAWVEKQLITRCTVHKLIAPIVDSLFKEIHRIGYWNEFDSFGGGYFVRKKRTAGNDWSTHSWGIALDFNVQENLQGMTPTMNPEIVKTFERFGFIWGGRWQKPDGMHFQFCDNY